MNLNSGQTFMSICDGMGSGKRAGGYSELIIDLLEKMNMDNIPNAKNIVSTLKAPVYDPTGDHSLVYTWVITGIAYNKNYVKDIPDSWEDLWNPEYAGRLILLNDSRETIGMALKKNGFSNNSTDPAQVEKAFQDLKALAPNVLAFGRGNRCRRRVQCRWR